MATPKHLQIFALAIVFGSFADNIVSPYMPLFIASLTSSPYQVGLLVAVVSLAGVLAQLFWGFAGDSIGRRRPFMLLGNLFKGFFYPVISYAVSLKQLLLAQTAQSFLAGMHPSNSNALLAKLTPQDRWGRTSAILETIAKVSAIPGIILGGWIVGNYGIRAMFFPAGFFLAFAGVFYLWLKEPAPDARPAGLGTWKTLAEGVQNRSFRFLLIGSFIWGFGSNLVSPLVPTLIFAVKLHFDAGQLALLSMISVVTAVALTAPAGILADRYGSRLFLAFAYGIGMVIILGYVFASSFWQVALLVFLSAVAGAAGAGPTFALLSRLSPAWMRGSLMGLFALYVGMTQAVAPVLGGFLWDGIGFTATFVLAAILHAVGAMVIYFRVRD